MKFLNSDVLSVSVNIICFYLSRRYFKGGKQNILISCQPFTVIKKKLQPKTFR